MMPVRLPVFPTPKLYNEIEMIFNICYSMNSKTFDEELKTKDSKKINVKFRKEKETSKERFQTNEFKVKDSKNKQTDFKKGIKNRYSKKARRTKM